MNKHIVDLQVCAHGSLWLFHPVTPSANTWLDKHCPRDEDHHYHSGALVAEHRYVESIIGLALRDGLICGH